MQTSKLYISFALLLTRCAVLAKALAWLPTENYNQQLWRGINCPPPPRLSCYLVRMLYGSNRHEARKPHILMSPMSPTKLWFSLKTLPGLLYPWLLAQMVIISAPVSMPSSAPLYHGLPAHPELCNPWARHPIGRILRRLHPQTGYMDGEVSSPPWNGQSLCGYGLDQLECEAHSESLKWLSSPPPKSQSGKPEREVAVVS